MKRKYIFLLGLMLLCAMGMYATTGDDSNLYVTISTEYKLKADKDGRLSSVKSRDELTYRAKFYEDKATAYKSYGNSITIDKASAPGVKPYYSQMIGEDVFYEDYRVCLMRLNLKPDKPVDVVFERTFHDPAQFCEIPFAALNDVNRYSVLIEVPAVLVEKIKFTPVNFPAAAEVNRTEHPDGSLTYMYVIKDHKKMADESMSPSSTYFRPYIRVTGHFADVAELYNYLHSFVSAEPQSTEIDALARQLTANLTNDTDKINAIATWVRQNIRYVAIEHGEYGQRPELASNVLANRFGDCKGSANLIKALLKSAGLDGRLVWIGTRNEINTSWADVPTMASGNHMIAASIVDGNIVFIDGTTEYSPAGYVPSQLWGQSALIEDGDSYLLATVPAPAEQSDLDLFKATYSIGDDLMLKGEISHTYSGLFARMYDSSYHSITAARRDNLLHVLAANGRKSATVEKVDFKRESPDSPQAVLTATLTDQNAVKRAGNRLLLSLSLLDPGFVETFDTTKRVNPISLPYPCRYRSQIDINLPENVSMASVPEKMDIKSKWFNASVEYTLTDHTLHVDADVATDSLYVPREQLAEWNDDIRNLKKALNPVIKLTNN